MDKRGIWLAEETLKIIIAVIVIIFLAFFLASLYYANKDAEDLKFAEASIDYLFEQINAKSITADIYNPKEWALMSWPYAGEKEIPNSCLNLGWKSCICIVKDIGMFTEAWSTLPFTDSPRERYLQQSDDNGVCRENKQNFVVKLGESQGIIPINEDSPTININYEGKSISQ